MNAATTDFQNSLVEVMNKVGIITINIRERMRSINIEVEMEMLKAFLQVDVDPGIRAAIITGSGEKPSCAFMGNRALDFNFK